MARLHSTLAEYLARLKAGEAVPLPPGGEAWADHVRRVSAEGRIAQVSEEQYDYWLEVLPPHWMSGSHFWFAEGAEAFRLFWHEPSSGRYFTRQLSWEETLRFCELADIPRAFLTRSSRGRHAGSCHPRNGPLCADQPAMSSTWPLSSSKSQY